MASQYSLGYYGMSLYIISMAMLMANGLGLDDEHNTFIHFAHQMKRRMPTLDNTSCWVCSLLPVSSEHGLPMIPSPLSAENMTWAPSLQDPTGKTFTSWKAMGVTAREYTIVIPKVGEWCFLNDGNTTVGNSVCKAYFNGTHFGTTRGDGIILTDGYTHGRTLWMYAKPFNCTQVLSVYKMWNEKILLDCNEKYPGLSKEDSRCYLCLCKDVSDSPRFDRLTVWSGWAARMYQDMSYDGGSLLYGVYWVCGDKAYIVLPKEWNGSCYLAWLNPPITFRKELPHEKIRNARDAKEDIAKTRPMTWRALNDWTGGCAAFPYACGGAFWRVGEGLIRVQGVLEQMANDTADAILDLAIEQKQIRQLALQNRLALDLLLSAQGGTCALIGQECCVYIPDVYNETWDRAHHIREVAKDLAGKYKLVWPDLFSWFPDVGGWLHSLIKTLLALFVAILIIYIVIRCSCVVIANMLKLRKKQKHTRVY